MLDWLYNIFVTIVSFILGLFGFDLKKRSVTFADEVEKKEETDDKSQETPVEVIAEATTSETTTTETTE